MLSAMKQQNKKWGEGRRIRPTVTCFTVKFRAGASAIPI